MAFRVQIQASKQEDTHIKESSPRSSSEGGTNFRVFRVTTQNCADIYLHTNIVYVRDLSRNRCCFTHSAPQNPSHPSTSTCLTLRLAVGYLCAHTHTHTTYIHIQCERCSSAHRRVELMRGNTNTPILYIYIYICTHLIRYSYCVRKIAVLLCVTAVWVWGHPENISSWRRME